MRYELNGKMLSISQDMPYLKIYRIDYPNIARTAQSTVSISTNIASTGGGPGCSPPLPEAMRPTAPSRIRRITSSGKCWANNLREILRETDKVSASAPGAASATPPASGLANAAQPQLAAAASASALKLNSSRGGNERRLQLLPRLRQPPSKHLRR